MNRRLSSAGFTMTELLVACGLSSLLLAGMMTGALALQRGYSSAQHQILCQEDQMRVMDYLTRDLRRATSVTISNQNRMLAMTLPDQVDLAASALRLPSIVGGAVQYGNTPAAVSYYVSGTAFVRKENGVATNLSTNRFGLEGFSVVDEAPGSAPALLRFTVSFVQKFSRAGGADALAATRCSSVVRLRNKADVLVQ
jgi:Tfp pilus assembly protein PilW